MERKEDGEDVVSGGEGGWGGCGEWREGTGELTSEDQREGPTK